MYHIRHIAYFLNTHAPASVSRPRKIDLLQQCRKKADSTNILVAQEVAVIFGKELASVFQRSWEQDLRGYFGALESGVECLT